CYIHCHPFCLLIPHLQQSPLFPYTTLFRSSNSIIIAENTDSSQLRAASIAVAQRVPMVTYDDSMRSELIAQIDALGITRILLVGDLPFASTHGDLEILHDPGTTQALGEMTA